MRWISLIITLSCSSIIPANMAKGTSKTEHFRIRTVNDEPCFKCATLSSQKTTICIHMTMKCDGYSDCPDGSDEDYRLCYGDSCVANLHSHELCNGVKDCIDGRDENIDRCKSKVNQMGLGMAVTVYFFMPLVIMIAVLIACVLCYGRCSTSRYDPALDAITVRFPSPCSEIQHGRHSLKSNTNTYTAISV